MIHNALNKSVARSHQWLKANYILIFLAYLLAPLPTFMIWPILDH